MSNGEKVKLEGMDRAGELPVERRVAERRAGQPALVTEMASTIAALKEQVFALEAARDLLLAASKDMYNKTYAEKGVRISSADEGLRNAAVEAGNLFVAVLDSFKATQQPAAILALASQPAAPTTELSELKRLQIVAGCAVDDLEQIHAALGFPDDQTIDVDDMIEAIEELKSAQAAPPVQQPGDVREAWEYSFTHSSATGKGDTDVGPCLTYDRSTAYGVGCYGQRQVVIGQALATTRPSAALTEDQILAIGLKCGYGNFIGNDGEAFSPRQKYGAKMIVFARAILAASGGALAVPEWISVDERLPEQFAQVAILFWPYNNRENKQIVGWAEYADGTFFNHEGDEHHPPSHWSAIPAAPAIPGGAK